MGQKMTTFTSLTHMSLAILVILHDTCPAWSTINSTAAGTLVTGTAAATHSDASILIQSSVPSRRALAFSGSIATSAYNSNIKKTGSPTYTGTTQSISGTNSADLWQSTALLANTKSFAGSQNPVRGCRPGLDPVYSNLCDIEAAWGIVVESMATLGFIVTLGLLLCLAGLAIGGRFPPHCKRRTCCNVVPLILFLIGTGGIFGLTFAFVIHLTPQTCPTRLFLFGILFSLCLSSLLSHCLCLQGSWVARGWGKAGVTLALSTVQVVLGAEWLIAVLVRDRRPCFYTQDEFVVLLVYVLCLLMLTLIISMHHLFRTCRTYSYGFTFRTHRHVQIQSTLLCITLLLSASIWVVWVVLLMRGNWEMDHKPAWDDPVLSVALVCNGWVLVLGHGVTQVALLCKPEARDIGGSSVIHGQIRPHVSLSGTGLPKSQCQQNWDKKDRGREQVLESHYESGFYITEIDPNRDYTIPRPHTMNIVEPYAEYHEYSLPK